MGASGVRKLTSESRPETMSIQPPARMSGVAWSSTGRLAYRANIGNNAP